MATLQTIRNRGGLLISIVIGLALVAFVVGDALSSGSSVINNSRNQIGEIAGEAISIVDYQNKVGRNEEMVKMMNNSAALTEEQQSMLRENTWQQMIMESLMGHEYDELGIEVSGDELYDILLGENMTPAVQQLFADPNTGAVDLDHARTVIKSLIEAPANTPQRAYWLNMEEEIATSQKLAKYNHLLSKALFITDEQAKETAANEAAKSDISYIVKNYSTISDSSIKISDSEIKEYYNANQKRFDQLESRNIVYVNFDITPSSEDFTETEKVIEGMKTEFAGTTEPAEFVNLSSDKKFDNTYYTKEEIENDSLAKFLFSGEKGVFGPYLENNAYKIARAANVKMLPDSVRARHILIAPQNNDYAQAKAVADSLADLLKKGANFESIAKTYSSDQNSAINGGDLGWFGAQSMVQPFSDTVFFSKKNDIKVVLTQYGAHVVQVTDMAKPIEKIQIAVVDKEVLPSNVTTNRIYNNARSFAANLTTIKDFEKKISETGLTKRQAAVNKNDKAIAGLEGARDMIRQIYMSTKPGEIVAATDGSTIFENDNKFTVSILTTINDEGVAPLSSVSPTIRRILVQKKKADMLKKELEAAKSGSESLLSVAQKAGLEVKEATDITFNSFQVPGAGVEPNVIAATTLAEQGKISNPIEGNQGVYIIMVNNRIAEDVTPEMIQQTKAGLQQANMYRANYQAIQAIMKNGEIVDQRYKFY